VGQILSQDALILAVADAKRNARRTVFTNGCFDLLHPGHIRCLEQARSLGDLLIVAINSDASIRTLKGPGRPIFPQDERAEILAALSGVDYVTSFDAPTPRQLIASIRPDVLVKGGDWGPDEIVGREEVESAGGRTVSVPVEPGFSTTAILDQMRRVGSTSGLP